MSTARLPGLTRTEARTLQRRYQRAGCTTWRSGVVYSGYEREGIRYTVCVVTLDGKTHILIDPADRVGGTRTTTI